MVSLVFSTFFDNISSAYNNNIMCQLNFHVFEYHAIITNPMPSCMPAQPVNDVSRVFVLFLNPDLL